MRLPRFARNDIKNFNKSQIMYNRLLFSGIVPLLKEKKGACPLFSKGCFGLLFLLS